MIGRVLSVNVGRPRDVDTGKRVVKTAIWKAPVEGRVHVRPTNVDGDEQADLSVHGGPLKAVYAYAIEDTRDWEAKLGRALGASAFGENLTTQGVDCSGALTGERWAVGGDGLVLEVVQPRLPCFKLGLKFGDPTFVKTFGAAGRPGAYLRIISEGTVGAGDEIEVLSRPDHDITVRSMAHAVLHDQDQLPRLLDAPTIPPEWRTWIVDRSS